jgi:4-amino-4-deoxy-L-arabinose transferase-like glycosyltransferase
MGFVDRVSTPSYTEFCPADGPLAPSTGKGCFERRGRGDSGSVTMVSDGREEAPVIPVSEGPKDRFPAWARLLLFAMALGLLSVWGAQLSGPDEPRVAGIAREMALSGDTFVPRLNGRPFLEYPSLGYLPVALFLLVSDSPPDFLAVLPIALLGVGTVLLTYGIGRRVAGEEAGLLAGYILTTLPGFFLLHRRCLVDPSLLFFVTLSLYGFISAVRSEDRRPGSAALFYLGMAGGVLSKGLIGLALPAAVAMAFLFWKKEWGCLRRLSPVRGVFLFLLPVGLWAGGVWWREGPGLLEEVFRQSLWRFLSPFADHAKPFYFYVLPSFQRLLPWTPLPLVLLWKQGGIPRDEGALSSRQLVLFGLAWFLVVLLILSLASAKRTLYLAPLFPPFALMAAVAWKGLRERMPSLRRAEVPGILLLTLALAGIHFLWYLPKERRVSFRPGFEALLGETKGNPRLFLANARESFQGAVVYYLGRTVPTLDNSNLPSEEIGASSKRTLVIALSREASPLGSALKEKGFVLLLERKIEDHRFQVYDNRAPP